MTLAEPLQDDVLRGVQVLKLIHEQRVPLRSGLLCNPGFALEETRGQVDDIVEVHQVLLSQERGVAGEQRFVAVGELVAGQPVAAEQV